MLLPPLLILKAIFSFTRIGRLQNKKNMQRKIVILGEKGGAKMLSTFFSENAILIFVDFLGYSLCISLNNKRL